MTSRRIAVAAAGVAVAAGVLGLAGPASATTPTTPSPSAAAAACDKLPWEAAVQGAPTGFHAGSPSGDYLWHDTDGFHLRVTHADHDQRVYSGVITSSAPMRMEPVKLEKGDVATLSANRREIVFVFADHGYIDGLNFHTDCATSVTVSRLHLGDRDLDPHAVYLGVDRDHPARVPFTLHRRH